MLINCSSVLDLRPFALALVFFMTTILGACDEDTCKLEEEEIRSSREVTLVTSVAGLGDCGYEDLFMAGVCQFAEDHDIELHLFNPSSIEDCKLYLHTWIKNDTYGADRVIVLAGNEYKSLLDDISELSDNQRIIMMEALSDSPKSSVTYVNLSRYGASYLAACLLAEFDTHIIASYPDDPVLQEAISGFMDGYESHGQKSIACSYLSNDYSGYTMIDSAYHWVVPHLYESVALYPLLGASELGLIHGINDELFTQCLLVGMDVDQRYTCQRVPFSVVLHIDWLLNDLLTQWFEQLEKGEKLHLGSQISYGLESKYVDIVVNTDFSNQQILLDERYDDDSVFVANRTTYYQEAIGAERKYLGL